MNNEKQKKEEERRTGLPSGRQATQQPEHTPSQNPDPETLHQGMGPEFQTQDPHMRDKNKGLQQMDKNLNYQQAGKRTQPAQRNTGENNPRRPGED